MKPHCGETESLIDYGTLNVDHSVRRREKQSSEIAADDGDNDLPFAVSFALVVVGMWKPSPHRELTSPENDHRQDADIGGVKLPGINENITTKILKDEDDVSDEDFINLKFESSIKKKTSKWVWRNVLIEVASLVYLATLTMVLLADGGTYLYNLWGLSSELLYLISYITLVLQLLFGPLYAFLCRLSALFPGLNSMHSCPLDRAYVLRRVGVLRTSKNRHLMKPLFMLAFISWPLGQAFLRAMTSLVIHRKCHLNYFLFSDISCTWGLVAYGFFWYLVYIERVSLHHDLNRIVNKVKRASLTDDVDAARREIRRVHFDYLVLRELMGVWMAITMVTTSWGFFSKISWDYAISGHILEYNSDKQAKMFLDIEIWSEKIMLIVFPCIALGGINLEYLWQRFYHALERIRSYQHRVFWMAVQIHATFINHIGSPELKWTLVFVLIGPYLSLQSKMNAEQDLNFWNGPFPKNCSEG